MDVDAWDQSRTVAVSGVPDVLPHGRMVDKLTIHFQRRGRSHGGDVEVVRYPTNIKGVAFVAFDKAEDAANVVRKEDQIMTDEEFPADYILTVFPFNRDVFLYVPGALVDLSAFGSDQAALIQSLRSTHRSLRIRPWPQEQKATVEGPFSAIQALRKDLIRRAGRLKSTDSARTAAVKIRESPLNPRVIAHREFAGPVSCGSSKAKLEPANGLSTQKQTTGEARGVQSPRSNAKTQNASLRRDGLAVHNSVRDKLDERSSQKKTQMQTESRTELLNANPDKTYKGDINGGIRSFLSGQDLHPTEEISKEKPQKYDISQETTRPGRISATKEQAENHLSSHRTDYLQGSDHSGSSGTPKHFQAKFKDVSNSSLNNTENRDKQPKERCIWVDSNTFRYIKKFDREALDRCLRGLSASVKCDKGSDLIRVILTEKLSSPSRIQEALEDLQTLVESRVRTLRVNDIVLNAGEQLQKDKVIQICKDVNFLYDDVLYLFEGSCVKVVGPSVSSHLFYKMAKWRISALQDKSLHMF